MSEKPKPKDDGGRRDGGYNPLNVGYVPSDEAYGPASKVPAKVVHGPKGGSGTASQQTTKK